MTPDYTFWLGEASELCFALEIDPAQFGLVVAFPQEPGLFDDE